MHVVGNENQRAFISFEREDEGFHRKQVEVGGRLVHEEQVRGIDEEFHQAEPALFSAAEHLHLLRHIGAAEKEGAEDGTHVVLAQLAIGAQDLVEHGILEFESIAAVLGEIPDLGRARDLAHAILDRQNPREDFQKRGLAGSVRADQHGAITAFDGEIEVGINAQ